MPNKEVPISDLVKRRKGLKGYNKLLSQKQDGFYIIYNGYSGTRLRERILQELNCNAKNTGTLNLAGKGKLLDKNIKISFIQEDDKNKKLMEKLKIGWEEIEQDWRYTFGVPILCRK